MKKQIFTLLTLLLVGFSSAWADVKPTISGVEATNTPAVPSTALNLSSQTEFSANGNGWIVFYTKGVVDSKSWWGKTQTNGGSTTWTVPDGTTAPFKGASSSTNRFTINTSRCHAIRFTGAEKASFLVHATVSGTTYRNVLVSLYTYNSGTSTLSSVISTLSTNSENTNIRELIFNDLTTSNDYVAYIYGDNSSNADFYEVALKAPVTPTLTGAWKIGEETVTETNVVQGASAPTVPTFTVGATSGTPTTDNYTVAYSLKDGSTAGIITFTDGVPTAISTATTGTATIVATLTTKDASAFLTPATNTFEYAVTVAAASAPTISISGDASAARGADAITLTADVTGTPTPTIEWFQCDDALKTNPVSQGAASTANTTFDVATATVGTYYFYAVANNGVGGDVSSDVKTITIVPKTPSITAGGYFVSTKEVTLAKADGEDGSATIKYSTNGGSTWNDYTEALSLDATTTVTAKVVQSGLESAEVSATYTLFAKSDLASVSASKTWDWSKISASDLQLSASTTPTNTEATFYTIADIATLNTRSLGANFDGTTVAFKGEYPFRNKAAQNGSVKINLTVAGTIKVAFADTGSSGSSNNRYLNINGVNTDYYANRQAADEAHGKGGKTVTTKAIAVPSGDLIITGMQDDGTSPSAIRILSIEFAPYTDGDDISVSSAGYATFVLSNAAFFDATAEVTAYAAKANGDKITLTEVKAAPAGTPVLLKADEGNYTLKTSTIAPEDVSASINDLTAGPVTGDGASHYVLGKEGGKVGFGLLANGVDLPATKAYIDASLFSARGFIAFEDGETTGVASVGKPQTTTDREVYNLAGQRVAQPTKGLYIVNGKKVIIK